MRAECYLTSNLDIKDRERSVLVALETASPNKFCLSGQLSFEPLQRNKGAVVCCEW